VLKKVPEGIIEWKIWVTFCVLGKDKIYQRSFVVGSLTILVVEKHKTARGDNWPCVIALSVINRCKKSLQIFSEWYALDLS